MGYVGHDLPDWTLEDEPAYFRYEDGFEPPEPEYLPFIRRGEGEEPNYTPEEEERFINEQIDNSQGFDIDFKKLRCIFNYQPVNFDDNKQFFTGEETTRELLERLGTKYHFVKLVKANFNEASCPAIMLYITFKGKDPSHDEPKEIQAKVCYFFHDLPKYIYCGLKPEKKVHSI